MLSAGVNFVEGIEGHRSRWEARARLPVADRTCIGRIQLVGGGRTAALLSSVLVSARTQRVAFSSDGTRAYAADPVSNLVAVIDTAAAVFTTVPGWRPVNCLSPSDVQDNEQLAAVLEEWPGRWPPLWRGRLPATKGRM